MDLGFCEVCGVELNEWSRVRELMRRFREAARQPEMKTHAGYSSFPRGSCTWASYAFGHLLAEKEPEADWHIVNAGGPSALQGHDWLESIGLAVDITADQFLGYEPYVGQKYQRPFLPSTRQSSGSNWTVASPHEAASRAVRSLMEKSDIAKSGG